MKKILVLLVALSLQSCIFLGGDWGGEPAPDTSNYSAVFMERTDFESAVNIQAVSAIAEAGKIYTYNGNLFINDKYKGFHVYNNNDPANPVAVTFINAPGSTDMAIKNNTIYINQATDLIAVELSADLLSLEVTKRIANVFPEMLSPDGFYEYTPEGKVLVGWELNE